MLQSVKKTLSRVQRIRKADEYSSALSFRPIHKTVHFSYYWLKGEPVHSVTAEILGSHHEYRCRLGLIVGKRHLPLAVQRNRLKRLLRETFRQHPIAQQRNGGGIIIRLHATLKTPPSQSLLSHSAPQRETRIHGGLLNAQVRHIVRVEIMDALTRLEQKLLAQQSGKA
ncbi:ribonuclease P protein component [Parvibium lacunae]|uniref:Ribonuclease P protein component n=1 Tax=Parvibium lacunae TaxID=1888893 RepID=A0A368L138_9BURK|nr:ribonuclease P protein component [Parvibium lacunae]RCS57024.1 ribonuclease P protein component [Parvibium lacunae]